MSIRTAFHKVHKVIPKNCNTLAELSSEILGAKVLTLSQKLDAGPSSDNILKL